VGKVRLLSALETVGKVRLLSALKIELMKLAHIGMM
jgi:hypothetical protein